MNNKNLIQNLVKEGAKKPVSTVGNIVISCILMILYSSILLIIFGLREDFMVKIHQTLFQIELLLATATIFSSAGIVSILRLPDLSQKSYLKYLPLIFFVPLLILLSCKCFMYKSNEIEDVVCSMSGVECLTSIVIFSIVPTLFLFITLRNGATINPYFSGLMIGIAGGNLSYLLLRLIHETEDSIHLFLWHFIPAVLVILLSVFFTKKFIKKL